MSTSHPSGRRPASRGNGGGRHHNGGRSSSRGGVIGGRRGGRQNSRQPRNNRQAPEERNSGMRDEDILIAFMPYLKGNHAEALQIYEEYQTMNDQKVFLKAARDFLTRENAKATIGSDPSPATARQQAAADEVSSSQLAGAAAVARVQQPPPAGALPPHVPSASTFQSPPQQTAQIYPPAPQFDSSKPLPPDSLFSQAATSLPPTNPVVSNNPSPPQATATLPPRGISNNPNLLQQQQQQSAFAAAQNNQSSMAALPSQPEREGSLDSMRMHSLERGLDTLLQDDPAPPEQPVAPGAVVESQLQAPTPGVANGSATKPLPITPPRHAIQEPKQQHAHTPDHGGMSPWSYGTPVETSTLLSTSPSVPTTPNGVNGQRRRETPVEPSRQGPPAKKEAPPPKRLWTHPEEQPGRILVKGQGGEDYSVVLPLGPREELTAHWGISLSYLRKYAAEKYGPNASLETVLSKMTLGLFRRGCTENGMQASIVSKSVLGEFWKDPASTSVRGKVPFYSPRTPGHVVFRLFWEDDPLYTLATGPAILVRVLESDFETSIRFILSNFKGKKANPTSLSSLHSLATILETQITRPNESAARATWGCIQEARKVLEACAQEHEKTTAKLAALEETVEQLKVQVEAEAEEGVENGSTDNVDAHSGDGEQSEAALELKEKIRALMSGRASCERKWRDSQLAFAGILRAVVTNQSMAVLLRRDLIAKMRIEYELWCPLSEEFAVLPDGNDGEESASHRLWFEPLRDLPQSLTAEDFARFSQARVKMQMRTLGFDPNTLSLEDVLFPSNLATRMRALDAGAVNVFNSISSAMGQQFQEVYRDEEIVLRRREMIRKRTEDCVQQSGAFPQGTRVVIFGSSANGFGSPKSDLDMCLQLPEGHKLDENGVAAMTHLAEYMDESGGMSQVDTARLSARIPIIMYRCRDPMQPPSSAEDDNGDQDNFFDCDLSMHNPLAVLNTHLLHTYAQLTPLTRVLSFIIKRWAKSRDINNPARHTLSSYGYILMLLHFLTFHKRTGNGLVSPVAPADGEPSHRNPATQRPNPLLPNLQWMDPNWPSSPRGTPYRDMAALPRFITPHPIEENKRVNKHFHQPGTPNEVAVLQMHFPGHDLSLAILLASFFRYYAYEFDYKRYVVSLHSTSSRGMVEREVKAELDGWRNYSAALTIEDPFETFYDVAHVLRGGYYHRIRREFAVAYSKIADAASGRQGSWNKGDLRTMTGEELIDWICEPNEKQQEEGGGGQ